MSPSRVVASGLEVHYRLEGDGPVVLLLHALGSCADDWAFQFPALSARYTALAPDLRGHGRTGRLSSPATVRAMVEDVVGLLDALGLAEVHAVGLSLGGLVAQTLAVEHPARVRSLVLVNSFARLRPRGAGEWWLLLRRGVALLCGGVEAQAEVVARALFPHPEQEQLRRMAVQRLRGNDEVAYRAVMRAVLRYDGRRDLARIRAPALVVVGADDTTVSRAARERTRISPTGKSSDFHS